MMTDRYYIAPDRNGWDITDEGTPIRDTDLVTRLNEQDEEIRQLRAERDTAQETIAQLVEATRGWHSLEDCEVEGRADDCELCAALRATAIVDRYAPGALTTARKIVEAWDER